MAETFTAEQMAEICSTRVCRACGGSRRGYLKGEWSGLCESCHQAEKALHVSAAEAGCPVEMCRRIGVLQLALQSQIHRSRLLEAAIAMVEISRRETAKRLAVAEATAAAFRQSLSNPN